MKQDVTEKSSPAAPASSKNRALDIRDKQKVAAFWGESAPTSEVIFYNFGPVVDYMLQCVSGDPEARASEGWVESWAIEDFLHDLIPVDECLSLCCGLGLKDRRLARLGMFKHCTGLDISEGAIREAKAAAALEGINNLDYQVADLDTTNLGEEKYDLVYASGALHHISQLERIIGQIHRCLKPGGVLLSDEYVRPPYNGFSHRHRELINAAFTCCRPDCGMSVKTPSYHENGSRPPGNGDCLNCSASLP